MPSLDDNIEDLASSADQTLDVDAGQMAEQSEAVSSPATGESDDNELLNVVRDVVGERASSTAASPAAGSEEQQDQVDGKQPDDEAFTDVPFNKHPRFQQLLRQRDNYKQGDERYNNVVRYLDEQGLSSEEAAEGLELMGLMKTNPAEAWKRLRPTLEKLLVAAGEVPSPELMQRVNAGELTQAAALEISRAQATTRSMEARRTFETESGERRQSREAQQAALNAVSEWENERAIRDPNFSAKRPALEREVLYLLNKEGRPSTAEGVKDQLKRAYDAVNKTFQPPAAKAPAAPRQIRPVNGGQKAGTQASVTEGTSTLDIIRANRRTA